jgi:ATP-binding cassette subfamily B protein
VSNDPSAAPEQSNARLIRRLLGLAWEHRAACVGLLCLQALVMLASAAVFKLVGLGIDHVRHVADPSVSEPPIPFWLPNGFFASGASGTIFVVAGIITVLALFRMGVIYTYTVGLNKLLHQGIVSGLRTRVFAKLQRLSFRFFDAHASGSIINRVTTDTHAVRLFVDGVIVQLAIQGISLVIYSTLMFQLHAGLTLVCLATIPFQCWWSARFARRVRPAYQRNSERMDTMVLRFSESIQGMQTVKAFGIEDREARRFGESVADIRDGKKEIYGEICLYWPVLDGLNNISMMIMLGYGGLLVIRGELALGSGLVVCAGLLQQLTQQITNFAGLVDNVQQCLNGSRRIFEILDTPEDVATKSDATTPSTIDGRIAFENVTFGFRDGRSVLHDISFAAAPGEIVAIAGATGAGKSALLSLIPRFYDPIAGRITLDGADLRDLPVDLLRSNIGVVFQDNFLFSNTIAANIAFGHPTATREQIERAARTAKAHEFIAEFEDGYDTVLGESGVNLSGGQRQRIAIARALLLDPKILILDDPTSAIDPGTEHEILEAMESAMQGRTTFLVAHRMSTLRRAHRILVLDAGRIIQTGTHDALMVAPGPYRTAMRIQSGEDDVFAIPAAAEFGGLA